MKRYRFLSFFISIACVFVLTANARSDDGSGSESLKRYEYAAEKMGVPVRVILYAANEDQALAVSNAVWKRFDELNATLSDYDPESEIIQVCRKSAESGGFVEVSPDLRLALEESRKFCEWTGGAFDATVSPIVKLWRRSRYFHSRPPESALLPAKKLVGLDVWSLDARGVKTEPNVRFDVGGIAKGIALDEALKAAQNLGVKSVLVDASGDLRLGAAPPGKKGWKIGVASLNSEPACYCELSDVGICASGDANRYVEIDGVRYSHIIDPRTCEPLTRRCVASVLAPTATAADALASALCVVGGEEFPEIVDRVSRELALEKGAIEYLLLQASDDADPPYTPETTSVFASPLFQEALIDQTSCLSR